MAVLICSANELIEKGQESNEDRATIEMLLVKKAISVMLEKKVTACVIKGLTSFTSTIAEGLILDGFLIERATGISSLGDPLKDDYMVIVAIGSEH